MTTQKTPQTQTRTSLFSRIEEISIAACLGLMTLLTFSNVVVRYVFNGNILWALELTVFLFAWLVLMGMSYGVKTRFHIGVDVVTNYLPPPFKKYCALLAVFCCLVFSVILLVSAWQYWYPFIGKLAFLETQDIPMPAWLDFLSHWLNEGESYEKIPRFIPYLALPLGALLLLIRFIEQLFLILNNQTTSLIVSHEMEEKSDDLTKQEAPR